ncbi:MAG: hypothetical protein N2C14_05485, partial [Planctomycetales bacterium]
MKTWKRFMMVAAATLLTCCATVAQQKAKTKAKPKAKQKARGGVLAIPEVTKDKLICFALYTAQDGVLKVTAQLYPLGEGDDRTVRLETKQDGQWKQVAQAKVIEQGWTAPMRVENWDASKDVAYRVAHGKTAFYEGIIRKDPKDKDVITVAAFTGTSIHA